jgi:solute carrier family 8 (sodium/calcium exchanger)
MAGPELFFITEFDYVFQKFPLVHLTLASYVILGMFNGYVTFVSSILLIGVVTAVIGDVAAQLGCFIYLKDSVNAIAFVALGTSVPGS